MKPINIAPPSEAIREKSIQIGLAASLLARSPHDHAHIAPRLVQWVEQAVELEHFQVFYNALGAPVGYLIWVLLAPDVESRLSSGQPLVLHPSEWTEGTNLWIIDFVASKGHAGNIWRFARKALFAEYPCARYVRRREDGTVRKIVTVRSRAQKI